MTSTELNYRKLFIKMSFITVGLWLIPLVFQKYPDTNFPFIDSSQISDNLVNNEAISSTKGKHNVCPAISPFITQTNVDVIKSINYSAVANEAAYAKALQIQPGGQWKPTNCSSRYKIILLVAYRDRASHLQTFLSYMHPFLQRQQIDYRIVIVEQNNEKAFNRGKLFNIGFNESKSWSTSDTCFIFHDIDLLPQNDLNIYACTESPRHMTVAVDTFRYMLIYRSLFGGAISLLSHQFNLVNGFSNSFDGWGGEDDNLSSRLSNRGLNVVRFDPEVASYTMLSHKKQVPSSRRFENLINDPGHSDGLATLIYQLLEIRLSSLYTHLLVTW